MNKNELILHIKKINNLGHISELLEWDQETYMPSGGIVQRSEQMALVAGLIHDLQHQEDFVEALRDIDTDGLTGSDQLILEETRRDFLRTSNCPKELLEQLAEAQSRGQQAWSEAKEVNDFSIFAPHLEQMIELKKQYADCLQAKGDRYDKLIDEFEAGFNQKKLDPIFSDLKPFLTDLIKRIRANIPKNNLLKGKFPIELQHEFALDVVEAMGFDFERGRVDESEHPFCTNFSSNDVRLTSHYDENDFSRSLFSFLHEAGHGLYEQGFEEDHHATPLAQAISLGIHESQSRMWENQVGRSDEFWQYYFPKFKTMFKSNLKHVKYADFLRSINHVEPSFIRIDADEVTYDLHILIRYEIEQMIFNDEVTVAELPKIWDDKYEEYLGIRPANNSEGIMQDVHWSLGLFGYFPTYTLGNIFAAQFFESAKKALPHLESNFTRGKFSGLRDWLLEHIHQHGKSMTSAECVERVTGGEINADAYKSYLTKKYTKLFNL